MTLNVFSEYANNKPGIGSPAYIIYSRIPDLVQKLSGVREVHLLAVHIRLAGDHGALEAVG